MIASDWLSDQLGNLVNFKTGKLNSNAAVPNGRYPFFTCSQETFRTNTCAFDTECVLLAGNNANGIYPLKYFKGKFDAYQRTYVVTPLDASKLNTRFLYFAMRPMLEHMRSISTGAATKFLTLTILKALDFRYPPLPTQRKIASILSAYDDLIENNTRRIAILEEMAQAIYREWFVNFRFPGHENVKLVDSPLGQIPEGWEAKKLGDEIDLPYGKALKAGDRKGGDVAVYGSGGIVGYHDEFLSEGPGIVVGRKGNVGSVFWSDIAFYPIDTAFYVQTKLPLHYVYFNLLLTQQFLNSDAAVPGLNRNQAYSNPLIVPTNDVLESFTQQIEPIFALTRSLRSRNDNLRNTRDLLLPKLISGKLDVEDLDIDVGMTAEALEEATA